MPRVKTIKLEGNGLETLGNYPETVLEHLEYISYSVKEAKKTEKKVSYIHKKMKESAKYCEHITS